MTIMQFLFGTRKELKKNGMPYILKMHSIDKLVRNWLLLVNGKGYSLLLVFFFLILFCQLVKWNLLPCQEVQVRVKLNTRESSDTTTKAVTINRGPPAVMVPQTCSISFG